MNQTHAADISVAQSVPLNLWHNRNFNIFWVGQTSSSLGDAFAFIAIPLLVLQATGSVAQMGIVTALWGIGQLLMGIFAGIVVDRVDRRRLMLLCDVVRTLVYATIPVGWMVFGAQLWLIYAVTLIGSLLGNLFQVAYITAVANLVERDQITDANGRLGTTQAITFTAGPMLAGLVSGAFGASTAIGINAVSFAFSALSLGFVAFRQTDHEPPKPIHGVRGFVEDWLIGLRFLLGHPVLRAVTIIYGFSTLVATGGLDLFIFHIKSELGQSDNTIGIILGIASIGYIVAGVFIGRLRRRLGFGMCWLGGMVLEGVAIATIGIAPALFILAPLTILFTFSDSLKGITSMSLRQEITPDHLLGRVTSVFWMLLNVPGALGATLATGIAQYTGATPVLIGMGVFCIALAAIGVFTPARTRNPA